MLAGVPEILEIRSAIAMGCDKIRTVVSSTLPPYPASVTRLRAVRSSRSSQILIPLQCLAHPLSASKSPS